MSMFMESAGEERSACRESLGMRSFGKTTSDAYSESISAADYDSLPSFRSWLSLPPYTAQEAIAHTAPAQDSANINACGYPPAVFPMRPKTLAEVFRERMQAKEGDIEITQTSGDIEIVAPLKQKPSSTFVRTGLRWRADTSSSTCSTLCPSEEDIDSPTLPFGPDDEYDGEDASKAPVVPPPPLPLAPSVRSKSQFRERLRLRSSRFANLTVTTDNLEHLQARRGKPGQHTHACLSSGSTSCVCIGR